MLRDKARGAFGLPLMHRDSLPECAMRLNVPARPVVFEGGVVADNAARIVNDLPDRSSHRAPSLLAPKVP
jgi:hypothetical protein